VQDKNTDDQCIAKITNKDCREQQIYVLKVLLNLNLKLR